MSEIHQISVSQDNGPIGRVSLVEDAPLVMSVVLDAAPWPALATGILATTPAVPALTVNFPPPAIVAVIIPIGPAGNPGPAGKSITPVVLTASDYYNLPVAEQLDPWKIYVIPVLN